MKRLLGVVLFLALGILACQPRLMWWKQEPDSYQAIVRKWTRSGELYQGLKTILVVSATCPHPSIRYAHVKHLAADLHLSEQEKKELFAKEEAKAKKGLEFIITTFSDEENWWKLHADSSIWTIRLINDKGGYVTPNKIEYLEEVPIYIRTYYPVFSPWKKVYRVTFPINDQNGPFLDEQTHDIAMEILSAVGQITLRWDFKHDLPHAHE